MLKQTYLLCGAALVLAVAACNDSTGVSAITQADANQLAADMDAVSTLGATDFGQAASFNVVVDPSGASAAVASAPFPINTQFTVTKACPRGGQVVVAGGVTGTGDRTAHNLTLDAVATKTDTDCAFDTRNGVLTLNGNPNIAYTGHLNIVNGVLSGPQTQTHKGSFKWARTGGSGTCDVDVTSSFDPATHTVTVTGTFCGIAVNVTRTRGA